jgi:hypothetical protein
MWRECVVKKLHHHNAIFRLLAEYGNLMEFSRLPISSTVHVACAVSVIADRNIVLFVVCEV